jgi:class 3 adenylate cyclase/tetratricopeptide (TPR) repeat protein
VRLDAHLLRQERKVITALFCDVVGSTALEERMDPEDVDRLLRDYQRICRARIESHGGAVEKFIGDAVVGVFGVPIAHEDDPERAVRAALRIVDDVSASPLGVEVRIGVNTGEALVHLDVDPHSGEGFATGDTMNTAARLEAAAPVMGVVVGVETHRATADAITYEYLSPVIAKGKAKPVPAWRALHPVARIGSAQRDRTPFVGRDLELSMLAQLFERARSRPSTEFVTIVGEPGLGKSRLVRELSRHIEALNELVTWREGRCPPYGDGISFWALGEIVKAQAGILETDDQRTISSKLDAVLAEPDLQSRVWIKDRLAPLVGLETSTAPPERDEVFAAWRRFLEQIAGAGPAVFVIEDLHWADEALVAFLQQLVERTAGLPLLLLVTARPEVEERHPTWLGHSRRSTVLSLAPLSDHELEALIEQTFPESSPELLSIIVERAGGSPLYAEQLAAMLREDLLPIAGGTIDESSIPASVQALIAARIDALPPGPNLALMHASVVGKTFWAGAVAALGGIHEDLEAALAELVRREFLHRVFPSTMAGDKEFTFWHALVRDVAYAELTRADRARMHAATARWIRERAGQSLGEDAEIVVHHLDAALELAPSAPEFDTAGISELLAEALVAAGESAMRTEVPRAIPFLERALEVLPVEDDRRSGVLRLLGRANQAAGKPSLAVSLLEELLAHQQAAGDLEAAAGTAIDLFSVLWNMGEGASGYALMAELKERLGTSSSPSLAKLLAWESKSLAGHLEYEAGSRRAAESIEMAKVLEIDLPPRAFEARGICRVAFGDLEGEADVRLAVEGLLREGDAVGAAVAIFNLGYAISAGGPAAGLPFADEAIELAERFGVDAAVWGCRAGRLLFVADLGRFDEVLDESRPILDWSAAHDDASSRFAVLLSLALVEIQRGSGTVDPVELVELATGLKWFDHSLIPAQLALALGDRDLARSIVPRAAAHALPKNSFSAARTCVEAGLAEVCEDFLSRAVARYPAEEAAISGGKAVLAEVKGELPAASGDYARAAETFGALGMLPDQAHALQGLGRCLLALEEAEEGVARLKEARALWEGMKAAPRLAEIDELLRAAR